MRCVPRGTIDLPNLDFLIVGSTTSSAALSRMFVPKLEFLQFLNPKEEDGSLPSITGSVESQDCPAIYDRLFILRLDINDHMVMSCGFSHVSRFMELHVPNLEGLRLSVTLDIGISAHDYITPQVHEVHWAAPGVARISATKKVRLDVASDPTDDEPLDMLF